MPTQLQTMKPRLLLSNKNFEITINRLCYQLIENHDDFTKSAIIGMQPRGVYLAQRIHKNLSIILGTKKILCGNLDVTFFRDDFRKHDNPLIPSATEINFIVEDKNVILVDDVLYTGRTIRAGLDAILAFGRPRKVELLVLIDRRYSRHLPIEPNYIGKAIDSVSSERVKVEWKEVEGKDHVSLNSAEGENKTKTSSQKK